MMLTKKNDFDRAEVYYGEAQKIDEKNPAANYNIGNVYYRKEKTDEAVSSFDNTISNTKDNAIKQKAFYNKGVAYQKANKLPECILAYKNALILNPNDEDARQNLERALKEQKKQDENKKDNKENKDQKKNQDNKQKQDQKKQDQKDNEPKPQPSKISKQDAEEKLKSLLEKEKVLQDKLHKVKGEGLNTQDKDW